MVANLAQLNSGDNAKIIDLAFSSFVALRQKLLAMGFVPGAIVKVARVAPFGGPMEINLLGGLSISLRKREGELIQVEKM